MIQSRVCEIAIYALWGSGRMDKSIDATRGIDPSAVYLPYAVSG